MLTEWNFNIICACFQNIGNTLGCIGLLVILNVIQKAAGETEHENPVKKDGYVSLQYDKYHNNNVQRQFPSHPKKVYYLPLLPDHPLEKLYGHKRHTYSPRRRQSKSRKHGWQMNPVTRVSDWWNERGDETARIFSPTNARFLWTLPIFAVLLYDIFVPDQVRIKRDLSQPAVQYNGKLRLNMGSEMHSKEESHKKRCV